MLIPSRHTAPLLAALALLLGALFTPSARAASGTAANVQAGTGDVAGQVVVRYRRGVSARERVAIQRIVGVGAAEPFAPHTRVLQIRDGDSVADTVRQLQDRP